MESDRAAYRSPPIATRQDSLVWENYRVRMEHTPQLLFSALNNTGADDVLFHDIQDDKSLENITFFYREVAQQHLILLHRNTDIRPHRQYLEN